MGNAIKSMTIFVKNPIFSAPVNYFLNMLLGMRTISFASGYGVGLIPGFMAGFVSSYRKYSKVPDNWEEKLIERK